jgi:hypothetical protein
MIAVWARRPTSDNIVGLLLLVWSVDDCELSALVPVSQLTLAFLGQGRRQFETMICQWQCSIQGNGHVFVGMVSTMIDHENLGQ